MLALAGDAGPTDVDDKEEDWLPVVLRVAFSRAYIVIT